METRGLAQAMGGCAALLVVLAVALAVRLPALDRRPMHGDEANQAVRTGLLMDKGVYHYDPADHHGPVLYFAALPFCRATAKTFSDTSEWNFRLVPVFFSCLTLLLMAGLGDDGRRSGVFASGPGLAVALALTALSPAMVYYSRFFIQESMFVTFLTGMLACAVGYVRSREGGTPSAVRSAAWAAGFGVSAGLALATKETVVLSFASAVVAALAACGVRRLVRTWRTFDALVAVAAAVGVAVLFYSSFFTYARGVHDAVFATASTYAVRATAVPEHQHPWNFYLKILFWFRYGRGPVWSEAGLLIPALVAVAAAFWPRREVGTRILWSRFLAVYTVALTALYSAIPYKTPWCALTFLHGYILLAGIGVGAVWKRMENAPRGGRLAGRLAVCALVAAWLAFDAGQMRRACYRMPADPRNPYVYAHTGTDAMNLVASVETAARACRGFATPIAVAAPTADTWPLPWYLRKYTQVGYWNRVEDVPSAFAPEIVVAAADQGDRADERFGRGKRASFFGIRPGVLLNVFVPVADTGEKRE